MALGGVVRDVASHLAMQGWFGESLVSKATGYSVVFHLEIYLLFVVLVALGPLARRRSSTPAQPAPQPFGLAQLPG